MAEKSPTEEEESSRESILEFLRRLDQPDQEETALPSTTGSSMATPSTDYSSLHTQSTNPWFIPAANLLSPINPDLQSALYLYRSSVPSTYLSRDPLAEFPWLLEEFDHQRDSRVAGNPELHDTVQRFNTNYPLPVLFGDQRQQEQLGGGSGSVSTSTPGRESPRGGHGVGHSSPLSPQGVKRETVQEELTSSGVRSIQGGEGSDIGRGHTVQAGSSTSSYSSSSKLDTPEKKQSVDAERVPRFARKKGSGERSIPSPSQFVESSQTQFGIGSQSAPSRQNRPPTSPLLTETIGAGGSTTSAGTSNTSLSSESTSNAGDEDELEKKEVSTAAGEGASSGKRKKAEAAGEEGDSRLKSETELKKSATINKPRKRGGAKRLREPRYAIKTRTDVDVLDDGFKWRKYGQKAVKNSPHPRNYYRCTTPQCPVRKRVERSNEDAGLVITTYEGTHTHQTPGFHRPTSPGYFGDRHLGIGGGLFLNPGQSPLGPSTNLLPLPPGFDLASLQATALRTRALQPNQTFPGSTQQQISTQASLGFQQESFLRAQQHFLGLQDPAVGAVKQEPFQFTTQDHFMARSNISMPLPVRQFQQPGTHTADAPGAGPSQLLDTGHRMERSSGTGPQSSPFTGLSYPSLPAASSTPSSSTQPDTNVVNRGQPRQEPSIMGGSSSRIDQSLDTLVSGGASGSQPSFVTRSEQQRLISTSQGFAGGLDQLRAQQRLAAAAMQQHIRLGGSSENLQGSIERQPENAALTREGLLQDMMRPGGPKVSKS